MSVVTNVILKAELGEEDGFKYVNANYPGAQFSDLGGLDCPAHHFIGGTKFLEIIVGVAAINHIDLEKFVSVVKSAPWREPENVQVFVQRDEELKLAEVSL